MNFDDIEMIDSYSRSQALADGVLIDISQEARENGFKMPAAITGSLFHSYIKPPAGLEDEGQSISGRLHGLFEMTKAAAAKKWEANRVSFGVMFLMKAGVLERNTMYGRCGARRCRKFQELP